MKVDMSEYIINAMKSKWNDSSYEVIYDEGEPPVLLVNLKGMESFEIDLDEAEHLILDEDIDLDDYVLSVIHAARFLSDSEDEDDREGTFLQIARAMDMVLMFLLNSGIDHSVGSCVQIEEDEEDGEDNTDMCSGIWINIGIHPVPFYFKECWENLIRDEGSVEEFVKDVIVKHIGKMP